MENKGMIVYKKPWYEKIFEKIKKFFRKEYIPSTNIQQDLEINNQEDKKKKFESSIKVKNNDRIFSIQRKLKEKEIKISDLTNNDLKEMIELYKSQIQTKRAKLNMYRNKILKNKKEA